MRAIEVAKLAGFSVAEMRQLVGQTAGDDRPSDVWRRFAEAKLHDVDALISRENEMKRHLQEGIRCGCLSWEDCVLIGHAGTDETIDADDRDSAK